jgi:hypothetical protein
LIKPTKVEGNETISDHKSEIIISRERYLSHEAFELMYQSVRSTPQARPAKQGRQTSHGKGKGKGMHCA